MAAGGRVDLDGDMLTLPGLDLAMPGLHGRIKGMATLDGLAFSRPRLALSLAGQVDAARFPLRLPAVASMQGRVTIAADVTGTLGTGAGPSIDGSARFDELTIKLARSGSTMRASGTLEARGHTLSSQAIHVDIAGVGMVTLGHPTSPALAELRSLSPLRIGHVDVPFSGQHLEVGGPRSQLSIHDLDTQGKLTGDMDGELKLAGDVYINGGSYDPKRGRLREDRQRASGPWYQALPPRLTLDLMLHGPSKAMQVTIPVVPDITLDFRCHLLATNRGAKLSGDVHGDSTYARAAVGLYDWLASKNLRGCQIGQP